MQKRSVLLSIVSITILFFLMGCNVPNDPTLEFSMTASPAVFSAAGQTIVISYTVRNPNMPMFVVIEDDQLGMPCEQLGLQPQQYGGPAEATCESLYMTTQADVDAGRIIKSATATGSAEVDGQCCGSGTKVTKVSASAEVAFVADEATAPITAPAWVLASTACNEETTQMEFTIDTGYDWLTQDVQVAFVASDTETDYTCETGGSAGLVNCRGSRSQAPGALTFCLQRSTDPSPVCQTFADFSASITNVPCEPNWEISHAACDGATQVYFVIDTGYEWLDSSGIYGYTATDGQTTYWCDTSSTAGQVNCYGTKTTVTGPLEFCFQRPEDTSPLCQSFENFPVKINMLACVPTVVPCTSITSIPTCQSTPGCYWDTSPNKCVKKP